MSSFCSPHATQQAICEKLGEDNLIAILLMLNVRDLLSFASTSKQTNRATKNESLWTFLFERDCHIQRLSRNEFIPTLNTIYPLREDSEVSSLLYKIFYPLRSSRLIGLFRIRAIKGHPHGCIVKIHERGGKLFFRGQVGHMGIKLCRGCKQCDVKPTRTTRQRSIISTSTDEQRNLPCLKLHGDYLVTGSLQGLMVSRRADEQRSASRYLLEPLRIPSETLVDSFPLKFRALVANLNFVLCVGQYGGHGIEIIQTIIEHQEAHGWVLAGNKITGDRNVPAGHDSFRINLAAECDPSLELQQLQVLLPEEELPLPFAVSMLGRVNLQSRLPLISAWYKGHGQINPDPSSPDYQWVPVSLILYRGEVDCPWKYTVLWMEDRHLIDFQVKNEISTSDGSMEFRFDAVQWPQSVAIEQDDRASSGGLDSDNDSYEANET